MVSRQLIRKCKHDTTIFAKNSNPDHRISDRDDEMGRKILAVEWVLFSVGEYGFPAIALTMKSTQHTNLIVIM